MWDPFRVSPPRGPIQEVRKRGFPLVVTMLGCPLHGFLFRGVPTNGYPSEGPIQGVPCRFTPAGSPLHWAETSGFLSGVSHQGFPPGGPLLMVPSLCSIQGIPSTVSPQGVRSRRSPLVGRLKRGQIEWSTSRVYPPIVISKGSFPLGPLQVVPSSGYSARRSLHGTQTRGSFLGLLPGSPKEGPLSRVRRRGPRRGSPKAVFQEMF